MMLASAGNTFLPIEYIITQKAVFVLTLGRDVRYLKSLSLDHFRAGSSVTLPKSFDSRTRMVFRVFAFTRDIPAGRRMVSTSSYGATASSSHEGYLRFSAAN